MDRQNNKSLIRSLFRAVAIPGLESPYNVAHLRIIYPAQYSNSELERNTGLIPPKLHTAKFPVVVMMSGINLGPEAYLWLAKKLAEKNIVTITYELVTEEMPGYIGVTPGLDLKYIGPQSYGDAPSGNAIAPILEELERINSNGILCGTLDLDTIIFGGHSAGGTAALLNANTKWFPALKGVFSYAAHTGASTALGFAENTSLPVSADIPLLLLGGTEDGCIAESSMRYGETLIGDYLNDATARIEQTFSESISSGANPKHLVIIDGANHFSIAYPIDTTSGRDFIDRPTTREEPAIRACLVDIIEGFVTQLVLENSNDDLESTIDLHADIVALHLQK